MTSIFYAILMILLWVVNLFNGTGLGLAYHTTDITRIIIYGLTALFILKDYYDKPFDFKKKESLLLLFLFIFFIADTFFHGFGFQALQYLWVFCLIFLLRNVPVEESGMKIIAICFALLGLFILILYNYSSLLSGWNPNSIAMISAFSYLFFIIGFYHLNELRGKIITILIAIVYLFLIYPTDSRSSLLIVVISTLLALNILSYKIFIKTKFRIVFWLIIPLVVALITINIAKTDFAISLNDWSLKTFNKVTFSDRDIIWKKGFDLILQRPLFGDGNISDANWHNCILSCLVAYGIPGCLLWVCSFYNILLKGKEYISDSIVVGCMLSFVLIFVQQSFEVGIISNTPTILPYMILGIMLGRVTTIKKNNIKEKMDNKDAVS